VTGLYPFLEEIPELRSHVLKSAVSPPRSMTIDGRERRERPRRRRAADKRDEFASHVTLPWEVSRCNVETISRFGCAVCDCFTLGRAGADRTAKF
jgi:hypothetical protein